MIRLTNRIKREIEAFSEGSLYRMNASTADCYVFSLYRNSKGKIDFEGGWDWSNGIVDKNCNRIYLLKTKEFKTL